MKLLSPNHLVKYFRSDASIGILKAVSEKAIEVNAKRQELTNKQYQSVLTMIDPNEQFYMLIKMKYTKESLV